MLEFMAALALMPYTIAAIAIACVWIFIIIAGIKHLLRK